MQHLIKQFAEGLGYRAIIEANVLGGKGIDVALEKGTTKIACEICNTTASAHELENVRKCLTAGFHWVAVVALDAKRLKDLKAVIEDRLPECDRPRVQFFLPDELLAFIRDVEIRELDNETNVLGYKVNTRFKGLDENETSERRRAVSQVIAKAMRRLHEHNGKRQDNGDGLSEKSSDNGRKKTKR